MRAAAEIAAACGFADAVTLRHGRHEHRRVPRPRRRARARAAARRRRASRSGCPRSTSTRSARAADRSRASTRAARSSSGRESAGAVPGPACYGRGGTEPTVTDADLVLGRIPADRRVRRISGGSTSARRGRALERAGVDADGRRARRRRRDGASGARRHGRARRRPARARARRVRRRGAVARVRDRRRARHARGDRAAARGRVFGGRACSCAPRGREVVRSLRRRSRSPTRSRRGRGEARALRRRRRRRRDRGRLPLRRAEPRAHGARRRTTSRPSTNGATVTRARARRSRSSRCGPRAIAAAPLRRRRSARPSTARGCVGPAVVAEPDCTVWIPDGLARPSPRALGAVGRASARMSRAMDPATLQVLISRLTGVADEMGAVLRRAAYSPNIKERADCSCRAVHAPTARCSCRPSTSRCTSVRCPRRCAPRSTRAAPGSRPATRSIVNDPFAGGTHLNDVTFVAPVFADDGDAASAGPRTARTTPTSAAWRRDRCRPTRPRSTRKGLRIPPVRWTPEVEAIVRRRVAHARGAARRSRRAARREPARRRRGSASSRGARRVRRDRRLRRAPDARRAARAARRRRTSSRTCSTRPAVARRSRPARIAVRVTVARRRRSRSTSPAPTTQRPGSVNAVEAVTVSAVAFALRSVADPTISRRTAARCGRCA